MLFEQCRQQGVRFFFKQWGRAEFNPDRRDPAISKAHPTHAKGGCQLEDTVYREMPRLSLQGQAEQKVPPNQRPERTAAGEAFSLRAAAAKPPVVS